MSVVVLWGINTHKCSACGVRGEWGGSVPPTPEQLAGCSKCGVGPWVELTPDERASEQVA